MSVDVHALMQEEYDEITKKALNFIFEVTQLRASYGLINLFKKIESLEKITKISKSLAQHDGELLLYFSEEEENIKFKNALEYYRLLDEVITIEMAYAEKLITMEK